MMDVDAFTDSFVLPLWSCKYPRSSALRNSSGTGKAAVLDECWVFSTSVGLTLVIVLDKDGSPQCWETVGILEHRKLNRAMFLSTGSCWANFM